LGTRWQDIYFIRPSGHLNSAEDLNYISLYLFLIIRAQFSTLKGTGRFSLVGIGQNRINMHIHPIIFQTIWISSSGPIRGRSHPIDIILLILAPYFNSIYTSVIYYHFKLWFCKHKVHFISLLKTLIFLCFIYKNVT